MDVFGLRRQLVQDYRAYIKSFIRINDPRIDARVEEALESGLLWPDPLIQLNPSFQPGPLVDELVDAGQLHAMCKRIFAIKEPGQVERKMRLHRHQADAITAALSGDNYVLTTGTGSGKSLAYIIPIVNHVLRQGKKRRIQAIVVYPMNALANSQMNELEKFLCRGFPDGSPPVTFGRYTGQESEEDRQRLKADPPDILLTNYVMLELLLTRPHDRQIIIAARGLKFLVLDELHTYRGRQGADVALLVRRVRDACSSPTLQCIGTSATLATGGTFDQQAAEIARVAGQLFGSPVRPGRVIGETLRRVTPERDEGDLAFVAELTERVRSGAEPPQEYEDFVRDPLAIWIESTFGLAREDGTGRLKRAVPIGITGKDGAAPRLSTLTGAPEETCVDAIQSTLLAGYGISQPDRDVPLFAFRLHQFISRGDTVYASLEGPKERYISMQGQQFVPGDRGRILLPLAFCRECGQPYYTVWRQETAEGAVYLPRELSDHRADDDQAGFLYINTEDPWPEDAYEAMERLPEDWLEETTGGGRRVKSHVRKAQPRAVHLNLLGQGDYKDGPTFHFFPSPFRFCLNCGVAYVGRQRSDFTKLASLSSEGRSTATTILTISALRALRQENTLKPEARKLLSFTDNRQDAALQAGHFNDFVEVGLLRAALYQAVEQAGPGGIRHDELPGRVFDALNLPLEEYATDPNVKFARRTETERALREVLAYRVYRDLRRGWRVTAPNLEQCGLLEIGYASLDELCSAEEEWSGLHPALAEADPADRMEVCKVLLDYLRRELALGVDYLDSAHQERIQQKSSQYLIEPWALDENESADNGMEHAKIAFPRSQTRGDYGGNAFLSARGGFGMYLRRRVRPWYREPLSLDETERVIRHLFRVLSVAGLTQQVTDDDEDPGYQVPASAMIWLAGDGTRSYYDPIRMPQEPQGGGKVNPFFVDFYRNVASTLRGIEAREHTAQVTAEERQKREARFGRAELPVLFCSPTMELGVDIRELNAVNMRNVPPTPANYAQRSGRAGRSGQPALVFTYCTIGSPHDQYFFKRQAQMVAGSVTPPRLDLANEDLIRAHAHAVWLAQSDLDLKSSLKELLELDVVNGEPSLKLQESVIKGITLPEARERAARHLSDIFRTLEDDLRLADWYEEGWLQRTLDAVEESFERACDRWRALYRAAWKQRELQHGIIGDASRSSRDKDSARRLRREAESQLDLLKGENGGGSYQSDFYSYRYFASEGFLPGYNFPRLPLSAYLPGRRRRRGMSQDEFLSRPRFLAISEFGPRSVVYHEGARYVINRVILPIDDEDLLTGAAKFCPRCGYLHDVRERGNGPDLCEYCGAPLGHPMQGLFRMQNVVTKRRDRISSDEEERVRMGYELRTGLRFAERSRRPGRRRADVLDTDGKRLFKLTYGDAATLWRINVGWRRRKDPTELGFDLDIERGYWATNKDAVEDDPADPMSPRIQRVVPYVEDRRNCLLIEPDEPLEDAVMASLQPALKNAIQAQYQLEDDELAAEPLPDRDYRRIILLYESAEGGAGVLRQLLDDTSAMKGVAREALQLCHFDPDTGEDLRRPPGAREDCEAACYDCLMSYTNQMDHQLLDRHAIRDLLLDLSQGVVHASSAERGYEEQLGYLKALCDSELERSWLDFLAEHDLRLPAQAQTLIDACGTRPDFCYPENKVVIYIDGPVHEAADIAARDGEVNECLLNAGYTVVRFGYDKDAWPAIVGEHPYVFGDM